MDDALPVDAFQEAFGTMDDDNDDNNNDSEDHIDDDDDDNELINPTDELLDEIVITGATEKARGGSAGEARRSGKKKLNKFLQLIGRDRANALCSNEAAGQVKLCADDEPLSA